MRANLRPTMMFLVFAVFAVPVLGVYFDVTCPNTLPREACFGNAAPESVDWGSLNLPLNHTVAYVKDLLQDAIKVEHSTIPLYLTALYSIVNQDSYEAKTVKSIVMEEMLHMVDSANVLNAIGGEPFIDHPDFIPEFPFIVPLIDISADIVWFTRESIGHFQILESTPPGMSISAAYLQIVNLLDTLCKQHGEDAVFTGNHSLQVKTSISSGQSSSIVVSLKSATDALVGVADQGGGCPVSGQPWPEYVNIAAGPLGGNISHAARYTEILKGHAYTANDTVGNPTGPARNVDWHTIRRFTPNPSLDNFAPEQCVEGGSWVVRAKSFFVYDSWVQHGRHLAEMKTDTWEECAIQCEAWTISTNQPLAPCAMWTWQNDPVASHDGVAAHVCLLSQGGGPNTTSMPYFTSGCQFGTVCNHSLPIYDNELAPGPILRSSSASTPSPTPGPLAEKCKKIQKESLEFASAYTALLVSLHNVFNGQPESLGSSLGQMYALKSQAIKLMDTPDPRISVRTMGIGPPWEYVAAASQFEARGGRARPIV